MLDKLTVVVRAGVDIYMVRNYDGSLDVREMGNKALIVVFSPAEFNELLEAHHSVRAGGDRGRPDQTGDPQVH